MLFFLSPLGGLLFRMRGGLLGDWIRVNLWAGYGTTSGRLVFAIATALFMLALTGDLVLALGAIATIFIGLIMGWWKSADIGRDGDRSRLVEGLIMTGRGAIMTVPTGLYLWLLGYGFEFCLVGLAMGLLYELGHRTPTLGAQFERGMPMAEFYMGCWLWLALATIAAGVA